MTEATVEEQVKGWMRWEISERTGGVATATLTFPPDYWPVPVGDEVYHLRAPVTFPRPATPTKLSTFIRQQYVAKASTFIGLLAGDRAEVAIELEAIANEDAASGSRLYLRSFHRHEAGDFESWDRQEIGCACCGMIVDVRAQSMDERLVSVHVGVVLELR